MSHHYYWEIFIARGFTEPDLASVVRYIKERMKKGRRERESLLFRNLIANIDNFSEDLAISRAESRGETERNRDAAKKSVMAATGREMPEKQAKPVVNIMEEHEKMASLLKQWRESGQI